MISFVQNMATIVQCCQLVSDTATLVKSFHVDCPGSCPGVHVSCPGSSPGVALLPPNVFDALLSLRTLVPVHLQHIIENR